VCLYLFPARLTADRTARTECRLAPKAHGSAAAVRTFDHRRHAQGMRWTPPARVALDVPDWGCIRYRSRRGEPPMKVTTVGLDLAKQVFPMHGVGEHRVSGAVGRTVPAEFGSRARVLPGPA
jgi:hypothetical protein